MNPFLQDDSSSKVPIRGCGKRKPGGLYLCTQLSSRGEPLEHFFFDPPQATQYRPVRIPMLLPAPGGINHLAIWVGEEFYPHMADFIEETRLKGISRRVPSTFQFEKFGPSSKMLFIHPKSIVKNGEMYPEVVCPKGNPPHPDCIGKGYQVAPPDPDSVDTRSIANLKYKVSYTEMKHIFEPGFFMWAPITNIDYVTVKGEVEEKIAQRAQKWELPVRFTDQ